LTLAAATPTVTATASARPTRSAADTEPLVAANATATATAAFGAKDGSGEGGAVGRLVWSGFREHAAAPGGDTKPAVQALQNKAPAAEAKVLAEQRVHCAAPSEE
jgi:hypothetical protein